VKTAIFGGSFNPVHNGHINLVKEIMRSVSLDKVIVMPANISPFKTDCISNIADGADRIEMCRLAFAKLENVTVSDYEICCTEISYTVNTLRHFKKAYPDDELYFIVGSDMLKTLHLWNRFEEIMSLCTIIAASRICGDFEELERTADELRRFGKIILVKIEPYEMSSTLIREKIVNNEDISCYIPSAVVKYIENKKLYK
jgi:nicotinate-nucleotide adenylyltransferase